VLDAQLLPGRPEWYPGDGIRRICLPYAAVGETRWLLVRNRRPGDRLRVGAAARKKLKELYREERIPRWSRAVTPVVVASGEPVWVVGLRQAWFDNARTDDGRFLVVDSDASRADRNAEELTST
jgi:tRNA(Ile)-lysidine synthetase-like protein